MIEHFREYLYKNKIQEFLLSIHSELNTKRQIKIFWYFLFDTGQERYGNMTRVYYKEAVGAFIVFDVTRRNTFESVANWKSDLDSKVQLPDGSHIPCVLLANKVSITSLLNILFKIVLQIINLC